MPCSTLRYFLQIDFLHTFDYNPFQKVFSHTWHFTITDQSVVMEMPDDLTSEITRQFYLLFIFVPSIRSCFCVPCTSIRSYFCVPCTSIRSYFCVPCTSIKSCFCVPCTSIRSCFCVPFFNGNFQTKHIS